MLVAYRISTRTVIPDLQSGATAAVLLANAVRSGIPEGDIEIRDITRAEFEQLVVDTYGAIQAAAQVADAEAIARGKDVAEKTFLLTRQQLSDLFRYARSLN